MSHITHTKHTRNGKERKSKGVSGWGIRKKKEMKINYPQNDYTKICDP